MALSLAACGGSSADKPASDTAEKQKIIIGISPDYPPYDDLNADGSIALVSYGSRQYSIFRSSLLCIRCFISSII